MGYKPSWTHNTPESFRKRLRQYAKAVENNTAQQESSSGIPPALRVGMPQLDPNGIALYPYTNQIMSSYPPQETDSNS
jgi:hypothetical protein